MKLEFWGATEEVTGSMTFLELDEGKIMIDCGLTQGTPEVEKINSLQLPMSPSDIKAVIVTHAHLDHSGFLPRLVKKGFRGPVYCTPATAKLMRIILLDSAKINDEDGFYNKEDVEQTLHQVKTYEWNQSFNCNGATVNFMPAGHILGASSVKILMNDKSIIFSGDLGRYDDPVLPSLTPSPRADIIVMESTYGGKVREGDIRKELSNFLLTVSKESRVGIIASFAVARAQTLLTLIHDFLQHHPNEKIRVVMDSPMMKAANKVYQEYSHLTILPETLFEALDEIDAIDHFREWESLKKKGGPLVILSSSGMLTGGRISRHLNNWKDDEKAILFLPGYQGVGTPGRSILEGNRMLLDPKGELFEWKGEVWKSDAFSSHADQNDLLNWVTTNNKSSKVFLLHGEAESKIAFKKKLTENGLPEVVIPARGTVLELD